MSPSARSSAAHVAASSALAARIVSAPQLGDPKRARAKVEQWLSEISATDAAAALNEMRAENAALARCLDCFAEASPYLWELVTSAPDRLVRLLRADPERHLSALLDAVVPAVAAATSDADVMPLLRQMKSEAALLIGLADIGGAWPVMQATHALTDTADAAVRAVVRYLLRDAARRGKLRPSDLDRPEDGSGYVVLAMGKMGAFELNYSSDIDLIVLFDPEAPGLVPDVEPGPLFVNLTRRLVKLLQERTADGYVFRTDLRLRPDPASTQIAISTPAALDYYEGTGQNWERAAFIKARVCAGDAAAGESFLRTLSPFVWRKYLDFAAVVDVHAMKRQMHAYRGHSEIAVEGHNIKLGRGGIREIEFFAQTQQLIAGGRNPALRQPQTLAALDALAEGGWIDAQARDELAGAYRFLRTVEHRLQMVADDQTHTLPTSRDALDRFARFLGFESRDAFARILLQQMRTVQRHYATLFEHLPAVSGRPDLVFDKDTPARETLDRLAEMGFRAPLEVWTAVRGWLGGEHRVLRSAFAREQLVELVPLLLDQFARTDSPEAAIAAFDRFLAGLHGGGRLLSLLNQNPDLVALVSLILGTAPRLADILARYPHVMDALVEPTFFGALPDEATLAEGIERSLEQARSYEDLLDRIRMVGQETMFLIGARILSGTVTAEQAGDAFAAVGDVLVRRLHRAVEEAFAALHGRLPKQEWAILALGKLGGREMTASSDLDLIVVYDYDPAQPESDGPRPLHATQYFARLTQRLISALSAQTNYGLLYQVDMRLRPSGRSGPVATHVGSFKTYQETEAWTWEHMALTRARVIAGSAGFAKRIRRIIDDVLRTRREAETVAADVVEMRRAIALEKGETERWNLKYAAGGLVDIEFIAQYLQLVHAADHPDLPDPSTARVLDRAWRLGLLGPEEAELLRSAVRLYQDLTQILRLCLSAPFDPGATGPGLLRLLARAADVPNFSTLDAHLIELQARVRASFGRLLGAGA